jgi:hypothetical protein
MKQSITPSLPGARWRHLLTAAVVVGSLALMLAQPPFGQDPQYHDFADRRAFFGIPNFFDVASNLAFLAVGIAGLRTCLSNHLGSARNAWVVMFAGVTLVGAGSAYYHWNPGDPTLVWDRLPMTIGFMGLFAALLGEYVSDRLGGLLLAPAVLLGCSSVAYWHWSGDLRFYAWVQLLPLLTVAVVMVLYRARYTHQWLLPAALGWYALAKVAELSDGEVLVLSQGLVSGHTVKHLLSATGCLSILVMLQRRQPLAA